MWMGERMYRTVGKKKREVCIAPMACVPGPNEFEIYWLVVCLLISIAYLVGGPPPNSLESTFRFQWAVVLWYLNLGLGSMLALIAGIVRRRVIPFEEERSLRTGLYLYAGGWGYLGTASVVYGGVLLWFVNSGLVAGLMTVSWGLASLTRCIRVLHMVLVTDRSVKDAAE